MGKRYPEISDRLKRFIEAQRIFFVATAAPAGRVNLSPLFPPLPGARNIFDLAVDLVQTSCGMAVPYFDYAGERDDLNRWAERKGVDGLAVYRAEKNRISLDGRPTGLPPAIGEGVGD